ncbi:MAG: ATP-binding cassette domain-containing protein, partial [Actinomycetota bacterium]
EMKRRASFSEKFAPRAKAAESRLRQFDEKGRPPPPATDQQVDMQLSGARTGKRAVMLDQLELTDLTFGFDAEIWFGDRVGVVGPNGTGKSHFLRLLAGEGVEHEGSWRLGAGVVPGLFSQTHRHPELEGRTLSEILTTDHIDSQINARGTATGLLRRYELQLAADERWDNLSGGQQARFQILQLELGGATLLLLDEPTDNLDVASAEALEVGLAAFQGTVLAVSHDRWFLRSFERFLIFDGDGEVHHDDRPDRAWGPEVGAAS